MCAALNLTQWYLVRHCSTAALPYRLDLGPRKCHQQQQQQHRRTTASSQLVWLLADKWLRSYAAFVEGRFQLGRAVRRSMLPLTCLDSTWLQLGLSWAALSWVDSKSASDASHNSCKLWLGRHRLTLAGVPLDKRCNKQQQQIEAVDAHEFRF